MKRGRYLLLSGIVLFAALFVATPRGPEDWDGIGFLLSIRRFDLSEFRPHPPGYPVYVALLRLVNACVADPLLATRVVASASTAAAISSGAFAVQQTLGSRVAWWSFAFAASTPLLVRTGTSIGSEAPALLCLSLAACAWRSALGWGGLLTGIACGVGLGVRLSWAPLFLLLPLLSPGRRKEGVLGLLLGIGAWAAPFVAVVGPAPLYGLEQHHAIGHFTRWGGGALTRPGGGRVAWLVRDIFEDGLGFSFTEPVGLAAFASALALAFGGWNRLRRLDRKRSWALLAGLYGAWVLVAQNLAEQPRHTVPLVALALVPLAVAASESWSRALAGAVLAASMLAASATDIRARWSFPAAGAQIVAWVEREHKGSFALFGGPSARFFQLSELDAYARSVGSLGEARLALTRLDALPDRAWVTSEIVGAAPPFTLRKEGEFCRPPRLDRRAPCITLYEWPAPYSEGGRR